VRLILGEMKRNKWTYRSLEDASGVSRGAVQRWRLGGLPNLYSAEAVLNTLGYDIQTVRRPGPTPLPRVEPPLPRRPPLERRPERLAKAYTGPTKLTEEQAADIRTGRLKGVEFAQLYGISGALVTQIQQGTRWPPRA
jgi:transcriptional regulator with XRE-family HTH domain